MNRDVRYAKHEKSALLADLLREGIRRQDWDLVARARDMVTSSEVINGWVVYDFNPGETLYDIELQFDSFYLTRLEACERATRMMLLNITLDLTVRYMSATGSFVGDALPQMVHNAGRFTAEKALILARDALGDLPDTIAMSALALGEEGRGYFESFFDFIEVHIREGYSEDFEEVEDAYQDLTDQCVATKKLVGISKMPFDTIDLLETTPCDDTSGEEKGLGA